MWVQRCATTSTEQEEKEIILPVSWYNTISAVPPAVTSKWTPLKGNRRIVLNTLALSQLVYANTTCMYRCSQNDCCGECPCIRLLVRPSHWHSPEHHRTCSFAQCTEPIPCHILYSLHVHINKNSQCSRLWLRYVLFRKSYFRCSRTPCTSYNLHQHSSHSSLRRCTAWRRWMDNRWLEPRTLERPRQVPLRNRDASAL